MSRCLVGKPTSSCKPVSHKASQLAMIVHALDSFSGSLTKADV
ncbi:MAG: hypothetical protein WCC94_09675 [Candidatus Bathyarchaeia archaeon]